MIEKKINKKSLQSREPQANVRKGFDTVSHPHYSTEIKVAGKTVGHVNGDEFVKKVHSSTHFLRKPRGIAFDLDSLDKAQKFGAKRVKIYDLDTGLIYSVKIEIILEKGFVFNRGFGNQIGLTLNYWKCVGKQETESKNENPFMNNYEKLVASQKSIANDRDVQPYLFNDKG